MNNADLIVRILRSAGITHGYGIPSGNVLPLMEAMRHGGIEFVLMAHEGSAGFAADVTGRLTGRPGLCLATHGPGATNLATGVGSAFLDRSPLIAITCTANSDQLGRRVQMYIDHQGLFRPITKASFLLGRDTVASVMAEALCIAVSEPQGPVHVELPEDVSVASAIQDVPEIRRQVPLPVAPEEAITRAVGILRNAKRPIAVVGASAMRLPPDVLRRFVERFGLPFATTTMAKGLIEDEHPLGIGCIERARRQVQRAFIHKADLVIGLGYDTVEVEYEAWVGNLPVLHLDIEPADTDGSVRIVHTVTGDLASTLQRIVDAGPDGGSWPVGAVSTHREKFQAALRPGSDSFSPHEVIDVVRKSLPRDGVLAFDVGAHTHQIASQWSALAPKTFLITNGWSSMGFGLPAAIAAKIARPELPVVCMLGDACFQMTCGEVAAAKRLGLTLPIIVINDFWLSLIRVKQQRRQLPVYGTAASVEPYPTPPSHYFGAPVVAVTAPDQLEEALSEAFSADGPTVIEAFVDPTEYESTVYD